MRIAVLGLGIIGSIWARHWHANGHVVRTWNRTPKPDAPGHAATLADAVRDAELVAIVVADPPALTAVLDGLIPHLPAGAVVAQHSTVGVADVLTAAARVRAVGGTFIDLPFTGSKPAAEARQNVFYVGDDGEVLTRIAPVYRQVGKALVPLGGVGQAMAMKLAMNALIAGSYQILAEGFRLATAAGLSAEHFFSALDLNVAKSGIADLKKPMLLSGEFPTQFSVKHLHKDLRLALQLAASVQQPLPFTTALAATYAQAEAMGLSEQDFASVIRTLDV